MLALKLKLLAQGFVCYSCSRRVDVTGRPVVFPDDSRVVCETCLGNAGPPKGFDPTPASVRKAA